MEEQEAATVVVTAATGGAGDGSLSKEKHRVDITESSPAQFSTWIFNFGALSSLRK